MSLFKKRSSNASISGLLLLCLVHFSGCHSSTPRNEVDATYISKIQQWQKQRVASLTNQDGWLTLAGLFWLKEGENSFGSHDSNDIQFPAGRASDFIGRFILENGVVSARINPGIDVQYQGETVRTLVMRSDEAGPPTVLSLGPLSWFIIKRGDRFAVRLRDRQSPHLSQFKGIDTYPIDQAWRIQAILEPYDPPRSIPVPTILGTTINERSPGALAFTIDGQPYRLDPIVEPGDEKLFVIFADETNGVETYGAGRFLYVDQPDEDGVTFIDFNKAYNPPCAFTEFATCPLPPEHNRLPVRVTAGEKKYGHRVH